MAKQEQVHKGVRHETEQGRNSRRRAKRILNLFKISVDINEEDWFCLLFEEAVITDTILYNKWHMKNVQKLARRKLKDPLCPYCKA
jgi:hypothetical protein